MALQQLLKVQKDLGDRIKNNYFAYNRTQIESRTSNYLKDREAALELLWKPFSENHAKLVTSDQIDGGHEYFSEEYFERIKEVYTKYIGELAGLMEQINGQQSQHQNPGPSNITQTDPALITVVQQTEPNDPSTSTGGATGTNVPAVQLIDINNMFRSYSNLNLNHSGTAHSDTTGNKYHNYQEELRFFASQLNGYNTRTTMDEDETLLLQEDLAEKWDIIKKLHQRYIVENSDYDPTGYRRLEADFSSILLDYKQSMKNQQANHPNRIRPELSAKLPKLHVPKFNDDCVKYKSFKQLFMTMVGSRLGLNSVEKFAYLKGQLEGEALRLIGTLPLESNSYQTAWHILDARFDNQQQITTRLLEQVVDIKPMKSNHTNELKEMMDTISQKVTSLANMGLPIDNLSNIVLYFLTERKIHPSIIRVYENTLTTPGAQRRYEDLMRFLQLRVQNSSSSKPSSEPNEEKSKLSQRNNGHNGFKKPKFGTALVSAASQPAKSECCCKEKHFLFQCPKFLDMKPDARLKKCREMKRCINCLKQGHGVKTCKSRPCLKCGKKHNTLLHFEVQKEQQDKTVLFGSAIKNEDFKHVFLATALVEVADKYGNPILIRALLDSGSQINILSDKAHRKLGLSHKPAVMKINGVGSSIVESHKRAVINLKSKQSGFEAPLEVFVVKNVTTVQPAHPVNTTGWKIPKNVALADPKFNTPAAVDLIIGGEIFYKLLSIGMISIGQNLPDLQNTVFGWVVIGKLLGLEKPEAFVGVATKSLEMQVADFWKIEEKYQPPSKLTQLEQNCERFFEDTTMRDAATGKFIVKLQFLKEPTVPGKSEEMAKRRFLFLEKKFLREPEMKQDYVKFMHEYIDLGHMEPISREELGENFYVIPHHAVRNPGSSTTKFRVVFDASAKTSTNIALNEILANGPMLQDDLFSIMVRFRKHRYVFSADISGNIEITAHNEYSSEVPVMFIPGINISDVLRENYKARNNTHGELNNFYVPDSDLDLLEAAIRTQKLNENYDPNRNTVHNTHHYIMVYLTLLMVAVFVSWYIYTKKLVKCCARKEHTRVPVRDIEMVFPTTEQPFPALRTTRVAIPTLTSIDEQVSFAS